MAFMGTSSRGRYDTFSEAALYATKAQVCCLIVLDGERGHGCSVSMVGMDRPTVRKHLTMLSESLRALQAEVEQQLEAVREG